MKEVINLLGKKELVPINTPVRTNGNIHYLHTAEEQAEMETRDVQAAIEKADYIANHKYKDDRTLAYGSVTDQLDMLYWDKVNGTNTWTTHITTIKALYPKGTL